MSDTQIGRVKWFNDRKGYGFLTDCKSSNDIFVHFSAIKAEEDVYKTLIEGEYVSYTAGKDKDDKSIALDITGVQGGPLLCENKERRIHIVRKDPMGDNQGRGGAPTRGPRNARPHYDNNRRTGGYNNNRRDNQDRRDGNRRNYRDRRPRYEDSADAGESQTSGDAQVQTGGEEAE